MSARKAVGNVNMSSVISHCCKKLRFLNRNYSIKERE